MGYAESFAEFDRWWDTLRLTRDDDAVIDAIVGAIKRESDPKRLGILRGLLHQEYVAQRRHGAASAVAGLYPEAVRAHEAHGRARRKPGAAAQRRIDEMILQAAKPRWLKVARIVAQVLRACECDAVAISGSQIAQRIAALVSGGRLDAQGDIAHWRHGEVSLHDTATTPVQESDGQQEGALAERAGAPIIASRILMMKVGRRNVEVPVTILAPVDKGDHWRCEFAIGWPDQPWRGTAYGIDAFQALASALQFIGAKLYTSKAHEARTLTWMGRHNGYGFPLPWSLNALAEGEDRFL